MPNTTDISLLRNIRAHASLRLFAWHPSGLLDAALAGDILSFIEMAEANSEKPFNRFADLSGLDAVHLSFADIESLAARRAESYHGAPVKSAILALHPLAFGLARMYQQLMRRTPIEVRVFSRPSAAATWLNVPFEALARES